MRPDPDDQSALALQEHLEGSIERVTFQNEETGFCVLRVKVQSRRRLVTVVGTAHRVHVGEAIRAAGAWANDPSHGFQFRAASIEASAPRTVDDLRRFLGSGLIKGVGAVGAERLVQRFGERVLQVVEEHPDELALVHGIGPERAFRIREAWIRHRSLRELAAFLHTNSIQGSLLMRIYRAYGPESVRVVSADPYRLAVEVPGFDFATADRVAERLRIPGDDPARIMAGLASTLAEAMGEGHCGLPRVELLDRASALLDVRRDDLEPVLARACAAGAFVQDTSGGEACVFPRGLHGMEHAIASRLKTLMEGICPWRLLDEGEAVAAAEARMGLTLSGSQRRALGLACRSKVMVLTGGPGVGKTTLVKAILGAVDEGELRIELCAPTGRAARRLARSTGRGAKTIHRLLEGSKAGFRRGAQVPLACDLLVVDEVSMVDVRLMTALLLALPDHAGLLLVGDENQLPSIGPGQVLADVVASDVVPVVHLDEVFRQEAQSRIITAAHAISRGEVPDLEPSPESDFYFVEADDGASALAKLVTLVRDRIPNRFGLDPKRDVQVLCPMNRGRLGARALNTELQRVLNPPGEDAVGSFGTLFGPGDKVMQARNDYDRDVSNGELGFVVGSDPREGEIRVAFDDRQVVYGAGDLDDLALAYATTIHKAQGSEYPAVVIPLTLQHAPMLRRKLLYTGVTRGSRLVVLLGSRGALSQAVAQGDDARRWSRLRDWLEPPRRERLRAAV
jgi:exodeoxyribonuclease V alpha subunit